MARCRWSSTRSPRPAAMGGGRLGTTPTPWSRRSRSSAPSRSSSPGSTPRSRPYGLTFARFEALALLSFSRRGALPLGKIGDRLQVHPTSVTNTVNRLERDGLVRRAPRRRPPHGPRRDHPRGPPRRRRRRPGPGRRRLRPRGPRPRRAPPHPRRHRPPPPGRRGLAARRPATWPPVRRPSGTLPQFGGEPASAARCQIPRGSRDVGGWPMRRTGGQLARPQFGPPASRAAAAPSPP